MPLLALRARLAVFATILRSPVLRRVELAYAVFNIAEWATWIAILVYAYQRGGPIEAGLVSFLQLAPAGLAAPAAAVLADRFPRLTVLRASYVVQGVTMGATALALGVEAPAFVVYPLAALAAISITLTRPAQAALVPSLARTPEELTAANVASGTIENAGVLAGPVVAGLILGVATPAHVFGALSVALLASALLLARVRDVAAPSAASVPPDDAQTAVPDAAAGGTIAQALAGGFRALREDRAARLVVGLLAVSQVVLGALDVFYVALALDILAIGEGGIGLLNASLGLGGLAGSAAAIALVGRPALGRPFVGGLLVFGLGVAAIGLLPLVIVAVVALVVAGAGRSFADVAAWTMLQRLVPDAVLARIFGILEGVNMGAQGLGAVIGSLLIAALGTSAALAVLGIVLGVVGLLRLGAVAGAEVHVVIPARALELLRRVPMFEPLEPHVLERLAARITHVALPAGSTIIAEGDPGDRFYVIESGRVAVSVGGRLVNHEGPGESFGEIALLRNVPRTATVVALDPVELIALEREPFLAAVTGLRASSAAATRVIDARLAAGAASSDPPSGT